MMVKLGLFAKILGSVVILALLDTQLRFLVENLGLINLVQDTFYTGWDNHLLNTYSQFMTQFLLGGWFYFIAILAFGIIHRNMKIGKRWIQAVIMGVLISESVFLIYWSVSSSGVMDLLQLGLIVYAILGLLMPLVLKTIVGNSTKFFGVIY